MSGPRTLSPEEAAQRWVDTKRTDSSAASISSLHYRLKQFWQWCDAEGIETMADLDQWAIDDFTAHRRGELATISLHNQLDTLEDFLEWAAGRDLVADTVAEAVEVPTVPKHEQASDTKLTSDDAIAQLTHFRHSPDCGTRRHVVLEIAWHVGCRLGALRGLDRRDYIREGGEAYLDFRHRPESSTPLKNGRDGERPVGLRPAVADVLDTYIADHRLARRDDHGRDPLLTTQYGRMHRNTIRSDAYLATAPCVRGPCPHDKHQPTCEYYNSNDISKCPSTRSPHQVRTGSISWQLDQGIPLEVVAKRVNASAAVIKRHYDKSDPLEELRQRRQPHLDKLDFDPEDDPQ